MSEDKVKYDFLRLWRVDDMSMQGISDELSIPYSRILKWKREYEVAERNGQIEQFINVEDYALQEIADKSTIDMSSEINRLAAIKSKNVRLQENLLNTAETLTAKIKLLAMGAECAEDIESYVASICKLQEAFFKQNQAFINIDARTGDSGKPYGMFLGDKPQDN